MQNFIPETNEGDVLFLDIHDLSIVELLTVNYLLNSKEKILRFDLYKQINSLLSPFKKLSTSSFYNSLKKLEKRDFLKFEKIDNKDPKSLAVTTSQRAEIVIGFLYYYFIQHTLTVMNNDAEFQPLNVINSLTGENEYNAIMVIDPETEHTTSLVTSIIPNAVESIRLFAKSSKNLFLLSTADLFNYYVNQGIENIKTSDVLEDGKIREPDNYFDLIIYPLYNKSHSFENENYKEIFRETKRLLSTNGKLIVLHLDPLDNVSNIFMISFAESMKKSGYFAVIDVDQIKKDLESVGFSDFEIQNTNGLNYICAS